MRALAVVQGRTPFLHLVLGLVSASATLSCGKTVPVSEALSHPSDDASASSLEGPETSDPEGGLADDVAETTLSTDAADSTAPLDAADSGAAADAIADGGAEETGWDGAIAELDATSDVVSPDAADIADFYRISSSATHACAWKPRGPIYCWGDNAGGQLGNGTSSATLVPVEVANLTDVKKVVVAGNYPGSSGHTCAIDLNDQLWCWGWNNGGQLGLGDFASRSEPALVTTLSNVVDVALGDWHTCALDATGAIYCWGDDSLGQLGDVALVSVGVPALLNTSQDAIALAAGSITNCLLTASGQVRCWGANAFAEAGTGDASPVATPAAVPGIANVTTVTMSSYAACAEDNSGHVSCWGQFPCDQNSATIMLAPTPIIGLPAELSLATNSPCGVSAAGQFICFGSIQPICMDTTTPAPGFGSVVRASGVCAVDTNDHVMCIGYNYQGQLGDGVTTPSITQPAQAMVP
jgi:hypothetical protein